MIRPNPALLAAAFAAALLASACRNPGAAAAAASGDPDNGRRLITMYGCGSCHQIPGVEGAHGLSAPPLDHVGTRTIIAGVLPNTPGNMRRWLEAPQSIVPGNAMPDMELHDHDARDIAAYLYTLR